jgi:hypothetical protein
MSGAELGIVVVLAIVVVGLVLTFRPRRGEDDSIGE